MFIGHFGIGFAAKKLAPKASLGTLFIAAQFLDLLWPLLLLLNIEHAEIVPGITKLTPLDFTDYPISHSLLTTFGWATIIAIISYIVNRNKKMAMVLFACVISHWILDFPMHRPDLPLYPGSEKVGLSLWNNLAATLILESGIFFGGVTLYLSTTKATSKGGNIGLITLVVLLSLIYVANIFGPPPPDMKTVAWAGNLQWLFVILAWWTDKRRISIPLDSKN